MLRLGRIRKPQGQKKKIVIVGGSHSGFSCTWLMLNQKPAHELERKEVSNIISKKAPGALRKTLANCKVCCSCKQSESKCKICVCKCFGFFEFNEWRAQEVFKEFKDSKPLRFGDEIDEVIILYRDDIKVFYQRVQEAIKDGYTCFDKSDFQNENGYLYSFTGLRGDAKELYRSIAKGKETRVKLV